MGRHDADGVPRALCEKIGVSDIQEFGFSTRIFFGKGSLERLRRVRGKKVLIVTDSFMSKSGVADQIASYLTDCDVAVFDGVVPDPPVEVVAAGVKKFGEHGAEAVIAVGGGSTIDAAKAIREISKQTYKVDTDHMECFAIPTTSGTGSEVTDYAVITDAARGVKYPLSSIALRPPITILDPELTLSAPPKVTADAGMDALTHAIEAYTAKGANDFSDALAEKAVALIFEFLPQAYAEGDNVEVRERMHNASCMAGLAFNSAGLGVNHGMSHAVGGHFHIAHGRLNAMLLPHTISFNADLDGGMTRSPEIAFAAARYSKLAAEIGHSAPNPRSGASILVREINALNRKIEIPSKLKDLGVDVAAYRSQIGELSKIAAADPTTSFNPRPIDERQIAEILLKLA